GWAGIQLQEGEQWWLNGYWGNSNNRDARRFVDVVNAGSARGVGNNNDKHVNDEGSKQVNKNMEADGVGFRPQAWL
ncbi:hypothetical protein Tco_0515673, partial [Tanacetum coccineum]